MIRTLFLVVLTSVAFPLPAHDLWIEREALSHTLAFGHAGYGHEGERKLAYKPDTVRQARCFAANGQALKAAIGTAYPVTLKADCAAIWFLTSSGYWSKTPYGTRNLPKTEAGAVLDSWFSQKSVKRIERWGEALASPLTRELELVPLADPLGLKPGDQLRLAVYFEGKAAAGVTVTHFGKSLGVTAADGSLKVRLHAPGIQFIQATLVRPLNDGRADRAIHATALQFGVK